MRQHKKENSLGVFKVVRVFSTLKLFLTLCVSSQFGFAEQGWGTLAPEGLINPSSYEQCRKEVSFDTTVPVHVECSYPIFSGKSTFIEQVNLQLKTEAEGHFDCFVQEEMSAEEMWEDGCTLSCEFLPVYQAPNLVSVFGCNFEGRGCHGCTYYEGKTYWQRGNSVVKLVLDDLFATRSGYRQFLLQYCENQFKTSSLRLYKHKCLFLAMAC
jgi:hypothetical protein